MDNLSEGREIETTSAQAVDMPFPSAPSGSDEASFDVTIVQAGRHQVAIGYANGWADKRDMILSVAGHDPSAVEFPSTGSWSETGRVFLELALPAGTSRLIFSGDGNLSPVIKTISTSLLAGDVEDRPSNDETIVLVQNIAAVAALSVLSQLQATEQAKAAANAGSDDLASGENNQTKSDGGSDDLSQQESVDSDRVGSGSPLTKAIDMASSNGSGSGAAGGGTLGTGKIDVSLDTQSQTATPAALQMKLSGASISSAAIDLLMAGSGSEQPGEASEDAGASNPSEDRAESPAISEDPESNEALDGPQNGSSPDAGPAPQGDAAPQEPNAAAPGDLVISEDAQEPAFEPIRVQAETATLGKNGSVTTTPAVVTSATPVLMDKPRAEAADGDAYVDFISPSGEYAEFKVTVSASGYYDLGVGYALESGNRPMRLDVKHGDGAFVLFDRMFDLPSTGAWTTYGEQGTRVRLEAGENTIRLTSNGESAPNIDYLEVRAPDPNTFVFQAEDLVLDRTKAENTGNTLVNREINPTINPDGESFRVGAEGEAYLDWATGTAAEMQNVFTDFTFDAPAAGNYAITLTYASSTARPLDLLRVEGGQATFLNKTFSIAPSVAPVKLPTDRAELLGIGDNHKTVAAINSAAPTAFEGWRTETIFVSLDAGSNTLRLRLAAGGTTGPNIDKIVVKLASPTDISVNDLFVAENALGAAIGDVVVTDADSTSHTFEVRENDVISARFEVVGGVLRLKAGVSLDYEGVQNYPLTITAKDAQNGFFTKSFTVSVTNESDDVPPVEPNVAPRALNGTAQGIEDGSIVIDVGALISDANAGDTLTVTATVPQAQGAVMVSGTVITFTPRAEFSGPAEISYTVTDNAMPPLSTNATITVTVAPVDDAATSLTLTSVPVAENASGAVLATIAIADIDTTYTAADVVLSGADMAKFRIVEGGGALQLALAEGMSLDFEAMAQPSVTVTVGGRSQSFTPSPTNVDEAVPNTAPSAVTLMGAVVNENAPGALVGILTATDTEGDAVTFSTSDPRFGVTVNASGQAELRLAANVGLDHEASADSTVVVKATDAKGASTSTTVTFGVADVNEAPTLAGTLANAAIPATGGSIALADLTKSDVDGDATAFGVRAATGTLPSGITIANGALVVADGVAAADYALEIFASDGQLDSNTVSFTLTVESPVVKPEPQLFVPFVRQAETGATITDSDSDTQVRDAGNLEVPGPTNPTGLRLGFSGTGYMDMGGEIGDRVAYVIELPEAGTYDLHIRYASSTARAMNLSLNGGAGNSLAFASTDPDGTGPVDGFNVWAMQKATVEMRAGANTISLFNTIANGPNLDAIAITAVGGQPSFFAPLFTSGATASVVEGAMGTVLDINATDRDGNPLTFSLTGSGADDARFNIDAFTGVLTFKATPDFDVAGDADANNAYQVQVAASDGWSTVTQNVTVSVTNDVNDDVKPNVAPVIETTGFTADENQTVAGTVAASDANNDALSYALTANSDSDNALFAINADSGALSFKIAPDFEALGADKSFTVEVVVSDGTASTTSEINVTVADVAEGEPASVALGAITPYSSQDRPQDGGNVTKTDDLLTLDGNFWKRAALGTSYSITADTKLAFDLAVGTGAELPEIVAVGFDSDEDPFDADKNIYQVGGSQAQGGFIDLRGSGTRNDDGTMRFVIDLGAHAGKTISSLVFVNDDDSRPNLGSSTFSNIEFAELDENSAPIVVGGGIADRTMPETGLLEVDLPFVDADGDNLIYTFAVKDAANNLVEDTGNLAIVDGVLTGDLAALGTGIFTVTVTASDGTSTVDDTFQLTVENVNEAPNAEDVALEPYVGRLGAAFSSLDVNEFAQYFSDADNDTLTLTIEGLPQGLTLNEEGVVSGSPAVSGTFQVTVRASDPSGLSDTITLTFVIEAPQSGDVFSVEAENFTGLAAATGFFATGTASASGDQVVLLNQKTNGSVTTNLSSNGLADGFYKVTAYVFDETDGASTFSLSVGGTPLLAGSSSTVTLNDAGPGTFLNPSAPRGTAANPGNLKAIAFDTVIKVEAGTVLTLNGQALGNESLRVDRFTFERVEAPDVPNTGPTSVTLTGSVSENAAGAVVGILSATDAEADAVTFSTTDTRFVVVRNTETGQSELKLASGVSLDHETADGTSIAVTATDARGAATTVQVVLDVTDINEAPVLGAGTIADQVFEAGEGGAINLAGLGASDPDAGDTASYGVRLAGGAALPAGIVLNGNVLSISDAVVADIYEIEVFATDGELSSAPVSFTVTVEEPGTPEPFVPIVIQAEAGALTIVDTDANANDTVVRDPQNQENADLNLPGNLRPGFTGTGYLDFGDTPGDKASFTVTVEEAGTYEIDIRYASNDERFLTLTIGGGAATSVAFAPTGTPASGGTPAVEGFNVWLVKTVSVTLAAGANTVSLGIPAGRMNAPNVDSLTIRKPDAAPADTSADEDGNLALVGPQGELTGAAKEAISFSLTGRDEDIVKTEISFDNGATRTIVNPDASGAFTANGSSLTPGSYVATVFVTDETGNVASESMNIVVGSGTVTIPPFTIQAEDATRVTVQDTGSPTNIDFTRVVDAARPDFAGVVRVGANGGGYMDFGANAGDAITINVDAPAAGTYEVTFRYANGGTASRPLSLSLNGGTAALVEFVPGPVVGTGAAANGWESWIEKTVQLNLSAGANAIKLAIPAGAELGPNIDQITFAYQGGEGPVDPVEPFLVTIEGETFTPIDTTGTGNAITQARTAANKEPTLPLLRDANGDGLWDGFTGTGYLDMGAQIGDAASFKVTAPEAGTYTFTFRYSNGGGAPNGDRPMSLVVGGETATVSFRGTGVNNWDSWQTATVEVELAAGENTVRIANTVANGPNIDSVTISREVTDPVDPEVPSEPGAREEILINFQDGTTPKAAGYLAANFVGFGDRGNGYSYGFVTQASAIDADGTKATPINASLYPAVAINERSGLGESSDVDDGRNFDSYDPRLTGYAHFDLRNSFPGGDANRVAFEVALDNGWYEVTAAVGDTGGPNDSNNQLLIEGQLASSFVPTNFYKTQLVTVLAKVEDGFLTLAAPNGTVTEIQYLEIRELPDLTPEDGREAPEDYARFTNPVAIGGVGENTTTVDLDPASGAIVGVDPTSDLILGVQVAPNRGGALLESLRDGSIKLYETLTGAEVRFSINTTAGFDSLTVSPTGGLKAFTSYTLSIDGFRDRGSNTDTDAPTREFQKFSTTFTTTAQPEVEAREVAFVETIELNGYADGASLYTSIEISPDGEHLYVGTLSGQIKRWNIDPQDGSLSNEQTLELPYLRDAAGARGIIGFVFDPTDSNVLWITDNYPVPLDGRNNGVPEFSGRVSKVTLGDGAGFTGTAETYIKGLPRSNGDHVTNSLEFRTNPDAGQPDQPSHLLYLIQGSNSAMGAPDSAWGFRPERLLNAAILEIDPTRDAPAGGFDVSTEPLPANGLNRRFGYENVVNGQLVPTDDGNLKNGGILINSGEFNGKYLHFDANGVASVRQGTLASSAVVEEFYNPYADDAVLRIFATGQRNGYDLVWHSNGNLYVSANGSAAGGNVPNNPNTAQNEGFNNVGVQDDYFFKIEEGSYSGHPNPLRGEFILNGGNPTSGTDKNEVREYPVGTQPDPDYDVDNAYSLGRNRSPNGAIEYKSNVFGTGLQKAVLFTEYSSGNDLRAMILDDQGNVVDDFVIRDSNGKVISHPDPLDVIEGPGGRLYLLTLDRSNGASQIIRLEPAPGGLVADTTADAGGDLALVVIDGSDDGAVMFQVNGLDTDIETIRVSFDGGTTSRIVTLNAQNRFTADVSSFNSPVTATLTVLDDANNTAVKTVSFTPGEAPAEFVSLIVVQAEDNTPGDGTSVTTPNDLDAQIEVRTTVNPEPNATGPGYVNGLRPGAFGTDGNTSNTDGVAGGYADFGATNADFITFSFSVPTGQGGAGVIKVRFANGGVADRPLEMVVNGASAGSVSFKPPVGATGDAAWNTWQTIDVPANLVVGLNTVTFRSTANTGPNIDQIEVLVPKASVPAQPYTYYEAESAQIVGAKIATDARNQEGTGYVDFDGTGDQSITWTVNSASAGSFEIAFRYALAASKADRPLTLSVNGVNLGPVNFDGFSPEAENTWQFQTALVNLVAGSNTITVTAPNAVGPNIDQLRIANGVVAPPFEPDYVAITGDTRIELEQIADNSTRILNNQAVEFFFTVASDGVYALDLAANTGAPNGGGLRLFLNGVAVDDLAFPGAGTAGEQTAYLELEAGTEYQLRVLSSAVGASAIDYLDVRKAPGNANADIAVQSLDPAYLDNRLHFSYLENPDAVDPDEADRDFKDSGTVRITNTGTEALVLTSYELSGPFVLANPAQLDGLSIAAGQSVDVTVNFNRTAYTPPTTNVDGTSTIFTGALKLITNDADTPFTTIDLAGFWQARDEGGQEPNVNEIWKIFGFGNIIEGLRFGGGGENSTLSTKDVFAKTDETEVLSPYWQLAAGVTQAKITQIAAFHGPGGADIGIHNPNNKGAQVPFWNHEGTDNQRLLPNAGNDTSFATRTFSRSEIPDSWLGNDIFGIRVAGLSTDPRLNPRGNVEVPGAQQGHTVKMFQALDGQGNVIPNVFLGIMDYTGINYDYNDNLFVIEGVAPVGFGQNMVVSGLDDAAADQRLVFTNIDNPVNGAQAFRNEAVITITNDGSAALTIESMTTGNPAFQIVGTAPTSVAIGSSVNVTVRFVGTHTGTASGAEIYKSTLTIVSDDYQGPKVIQLAGLAQEFSENGSEPTVAQIVEAFGYGTDVAQGDLAGGGAVETIGDEVLLPYLQKLDPSKAVEVIQIAAFLNQGNVARLGFHGLASSQVTNLFANDDQQGQTILPDQLVLGAGAGVTVARGTINSNTPFGLYISVDGRPTYSSWSDPEANKIDPNFGQLVGGDQGHLIRYFQALDASGNVIAGTFIGIQDYPGAGNYDYNDHMFVIKNVKAYDLAAANDGNNDNINDALQLDADGDGTVNFFDTTTTPPPGPQAPFNGTAPSFSNGLLTVDASNFDTGGQGVAYNDNPGKDGGTSFRPGEAVEFVGAENDIGHIRPGEWIEYTVNVPASGVFDLSLLAKTPVGNATVAVSLAGGATLATIALQDGGTSFANAPFQASSPAAVTLPSGQQTIRLTFNGTPEAGSPYIMDLRSFSLDYREPPVTTQTPFNGTAPSFANGALTVDASNYDNGGQGVAYNDAAGLQGGGNGGRVGSDVEQTTGGDIGWIAGGEWVEYTINVGTAGLYDLDLLLANGAGAGPSATVTFYKPSATTPYVTSGSIANPGTGGWGTFVNRGVDGIALDAGTQVVRVTFAGGGQDFRSFTLTAPVNLQAPFNGTAPSFSNGLLTVDASNFDTGGQGVAYSDNPGKDGGTSFRPGEAVEFVGAENDIGHIRPGEWIEYTVNVPASGVFDLSLLAKTPVGNATVAVSLAGGATLATIALQDGGTSFANAPFQASSPAAVTLPSGQQTIRLTFNGTPEAGSPYIMDLRSFSLDYREPASDPQQPFGETAPSFTDVLTVDASNYDNGGQGIAYNDTPGLQGGSNGGRAGSSVEATGAGDIGWIDPGEWVEYTINVGTAGTYDLDLLLSNDGGVGRSAMVEFFKPGATTPYASSGSIANPSTGGWGTFQARGVDDIALDAGTQVVRVTFAGGSQDFRSFTLDLQEPAGIARMAMRSAPESTSINNRNLEDFEGLGSDGTTHDLQDLVDQPQPHAILHWDNVA